MRAALFMGVCTASIPDRQLTRAACAVCTTTPIHSECARPAAVDVLLTVGQQHRPRLGRAWHPDTATFAYSRRSCTRSVSKQTTRQAHNRPWYMGVHSFRLHLCTAKSARLTPHSVESIGESCQWRRMPSPETARKSLPGGHSATSKRTIELSYDR